MRDKQMIGYASKHLHPAWLCICFAIVVLPAVAQEPPRQKIDPDQLIQELFPVPDEDMDIEALTESLLQLYANPLDLNAATRDELAATLLLSEGQLQSFFDYRNQAGPLLSLYELQAVPDFDLPTIYKILPFVTLEPVAVRLKDALKNPTQHFMMLRSGRLLEKQKGYSETDSSNAGASRYDGNPFSAYLRYRYARTGMYSFGFTFEKDAGETWWKWQPRRQVLGPDFSSFHAQISHRGRLRNIMIGDFLVQAGQGLVMGAGFSLGKGTETVSSAYRSTTGLRPYTSALEAGYFRGAAATFIIFKGLELTAMFSRNRRDATLKQDVNTGMTLAGSLPISGYHRTPMEAERIRNMWEQNLGVHALYQLPKNRGQVGLTWLRTGLAYRVQKSDQLYNLFEFQGKAQAIAGLHGDVRWRNFHVFGEGARSASGGMGWVGGVIAGLGKKLDVTFLNRYYAKDFHSFYGNAIGESSRPINETGNYWGMKFSPNVHWQVGAFYDVFRFPWLKYQIDRPSDGSDLMIHIRWKRDKRLNIYGAYREKMKDKNLPGTTTTLHQVVQTVRRTALVNLEYDVPLRYAVRTRIQYGNFGYEGHGRSNGLAIVQDASWQIWKVELSARIAFFKTDDYDSRQYVYEKDVLYAFSIPAYADTGTRHYAMLRYNLNKKTKVWIRWAQTRYMKLDQISSGLNEINGKTRSELRMQLMYQF